MANYIASARSNYFRVKDVEKFTQELESETGNVEIHGRPQDDRITLLGMDQDGAGWPQISDKEDENGDWLPFSLSQFIAEHLADDEVAVLQEVGAEKLRYLVGYSIAVNNKGEEVSCGIDDIYAKAHHLGRNITDSAY